MVKLVRGMGHESRKVRLSKRGALGPEVMLTYLKEERTRGFTTSVRKAMVALSSSQEASAASLSRLSLPPRRISLPLSSSASVMVEACVAPRSSTTEVVKSCATIRRPLGDQRKESRV